MRRFTLGLAHTLLSFVLILSLFTPLSQAQEAARDLVYSYDDFSKGLNTKISKFSLPKNQAIIAENGRYNETLKSLTKRDELMLYGTADTTEQITGMHRLYLSDGTKILIVTHGDEIETGNDDTGVFTNILDLTSGNYRWQWVTWHDLGIGTDGYNPPVKYDGSSASATYLGSCLATDAGSGAGPDGTYTYKITFYTTTYEVSFNTASNPITVSDSDINLTMIPIGPDTFGGEDVIGRKVYRTDGSGGTYLLLSNGTIANNTATTLTDSDADGARSGAYSPGYNYAPPRGRLIIIHKNRVWIANDPSYPSRIYYSEDGSHDYFLPTSYFNIRANDGDEITFIENLLGILTVGKNNSIQKIYTERDSPTADWSVSDPFSSIGCQAIYSADISPIGIIYLGFDGLYKFDGQYSTLVSDDVTPEIKDIAENNFTNSWGKYHKHIYHLAYTSEKTGEYENNRILLYDILNNAYSIDILDINAFCTFSSGTDWDVLYAGSSADGKVYSYTEASHEIIHRRHSDFTGTWDDARYIPTRWGGDEKKPVIEIAREDTIDELTGTINNLTGDIDREDTDGSYISSVIETKMTALDQLYWNETIPVAGGDVTFALRTGASSSDCVAADWSSEYTDPTGSDVSGVTANDFLQYRISLSTSDIDETPTVYNANNYVVRITYDTEGSTTETSVPLHWRSGWLDFGYPDRVKGLKKIYAYYDSDSTGTLYITFKNFEGDEEEFAIDLVANPSNYTEYFTGGKFIGELFTIDIEETSLNPMRIDKIILVFDVEPLV